MNLNGMLLSVTACTMKNVRSNLNTLSEKQECFIFSLEVPGVISSGVFVWLNAS